jgi:tetratricopeptide (TPR) repeat protein
MWIKVAACCLTMTLLGAGPAGAQKVAFVDAFVTFHSALAGTYGDEGPVAAAALERMTGALATWERTAAADEAALKQRSTTTAADLALLHADAHRLDAAIDAMRTAIAREPQRASLHRFLGLLYDHAGRADEALTAFRTARQLEEADPVAAYLLADSLARRGEGNFEPLVQVLERASGRSRLGPFTFNEFALIEDKSADTPIFAPARYASAFALMDQGRHREALDAFRAVFLRDPLNADAAARSEPVARGIAALRAKDGTTAVRQLETAVAAHPDSSEVHRVLGIVYRAVGRLDDSIEHFTRATRLAPSDERSRVALAGTLAEAGQADEAIRVLNETIAALPASGEARWALAALLQTANRGLEALALLEEAADLIVVAGKGTLYWRIAEVAQGYRRDYTRVIVALAQRVRLMRNDGHAHKNLGLAYLRPGRDQEALVELLMATRLGIEDAETFLAMGQAYLNVGRLDQAEVLLRRAIALAPDSSHAHYALGMTLRRLGREQDAREELATFERLRASAFDEQRQTFERVR